jgi:hypothetical protein
MVIGQLWKSASGSLGLALANPSTQTVSIAATLRIDGHTHLRAAGGTLVDGVEMHSTDTHLRVGKTLPPLSATVVEVTKLP